MAYKNTATVVHILAWDVINGVGKTGDGANFTLRGVGDGSEFTPSSPSITEIDSTNLKGVYSVSLTAGENNYTNVLLGGKSSTSGIVIQPISWTNECTAQLSAAGVQAIWDALTSALTTVGSIGKYIVDYLSAIKTKTDSLTFTSAGKIDANLLAVNGGTTGATAGVLELHQLSLMPSSGDAPALTMKGHGDSPTVLITSSNTGTPGNQTAYGVQIDSANATAQAAAIVANGYLAGLTFEATHGPGVSFQSTAAGQAALSIGNPNGRGVDIDTGNGPGVQISSAGGDAIKLLPAGVYKALRAAGQIYIAPANTDDDAIVLVPNGSGLAVNAPGQPRIKKNTALPNFTFMMSDSATHHPKTGLAVTAQCSIDGGAFGACTNAVAELSDGFYTINLDAADLNGDVIAFRFSATGADDRDFTVVTQA